MTRGTRWWPWAAGGAVLAALVYWVARPAPLVVDLGPVDQGQLAVTVDEEGETRVRDRFVVAAPVSGRLRRIALEAGDRAVAGSVVATMEPSPLDPRTRQELLARLEAALDAERMARASLAQAREALDQAAREHTRVEALFRQNVIAAEARERAALAETTRRREQEAADFHARSAAHEAEQARAALAANGSGRLALRAPASGLVLRVLEPSERVVPAGTVVLELGDPRRLEVVADVLSTDAVRLTVGDTIQITGWGGPDTLRATLRRIEPSGFTKRSALGVDEQRVNVVGELVDPPAALGDRYRVEIRIVVWQAANVVRVPRAALFRAGDDWRAFVVAGGRAVERAVAVGHLGLDQAEVLSGLTAGERVILHPDERVIDGARVTAR